MSDPGIAPCYAVLSLPDGVALLACSETGICALWLDDAREPLVQAVHARWPSAQEVVSIRSGYGAMAAESMLERVLPCVQAVLSRLPDPQASQPWPLDLQGTPFQQAVWRALRDIPAGVTCSYSELATRIGKPSAVRAVASACAANPVALLVPCHRVVRRDGGVSGYRWGVDRKRRLLAAEAAAAGH